MYLLITILCLINLFAFLAMLIDKLKSRNPVYRRISEGMMFFWAAIGGSLGIYLGMFAFRHKTKKWYFLLGMPLMILQNAALAYVTYLFLFS